jgi:hypothetical protein
MALAFLDVDIHILKRCIRIGRVCYLKKMKYKEMMYT